LSFAGFVSLSCGANANYTDAFNISWVPDDPYITTGNKSTVTFRDGNSTVKTTLRFFPGSENQNCYNIALQKKQSYSGPKHIYLQEL
jgi:hypothetical protein